MAVGLWAGSYSHYGKPEKKELGGIQGLGTMFKALSLLAMTCFQVRPHHLKVPQSPKIALAGWEDSSVDKEYLLCKHDDQSWSLQTA